MASVAQTIDLKVKRFGQWWGDELASLLPSAIRRWATTERRMLIQLRGAQAEGASVFASKGGALKSIASADFVGPNADGQPSLLQGAELAHRWRQLLSSVPRSGQVALGAPSEWVLRRTVKMPMAVEENLRQVVGFELDRLTPFRADQVYYDARVVSRDYGEGVLNVDVAVAPKAKCDRVLTQLREAGINVAALTVTAGTGAVAGAGVGANAGVVHADHHLNLLPVEARPKPAGQTLSIVNGLLALLLFALILAAVAFPIWQKRQKAMALDPLLTRAQAGARQATALAEELEAKVAEHNYTNARKATHMSTSVLVSELSNVLPVPNTWVQQLDVKTTAKGRTLQVQGDSTLGGKVQEIIEQSGFVQNTSIKSPIRAIPGTDRFQYNIEADLKPLPEPTALTDEQLAAMVKEMQDKAERAKLVASGASAATPGAAPTSSAAPPVVPGQTAAATAAPGTATQPGKAAVLSSTPNVPGATAPNAKDAKVDLKTDVKGLKPGPAPAASSPATAPTLPSAGGRLGAPAPGQPPQPAQPGKAP
jgi:general secretion pathway protein L